jgi:hypothetical protein
MAPESWQTGSEVLPFVPPSRWYVIAPPPEEPDDDSTLESAQTAVVGVADAVMPCVAGVKVTATSVEVAL